MAGTAPLRVLITGRSLAPSAVGFLEAEGCVYAFAREFDSPQALETQVREFQPDGLVVRFGRIDERVLRASTRLRAICKHGVGVDNIDVAAASKLRIPVMITASANYHAVAEHTLALLLALLRGLTVQARFARQGGWDKTGYAGEDLHRKSVGIVGLGRVGRRFAELLAPFETRVFGYDPLLPESATPSAVIRVNQLTDMLPRVDILSLHCPLTADTDRMIDHSVFARMRRGSWIVNTARGKLVHEPDLLVALADGTLRGAALDTLATEPPPADHPLLGMDNVIITNHIAGSSVEALEAMALNSVRLVVAALRGALPDASHIVNRDLPAQAP